MVLYHGEGPLRGGFYFALWFQRVREGWKRTRQLARPVKASDLAAAKRVVRLLVELGIRPRDAVVILHRRVVARPRGREHAVVERG